MFLDAVPAVEQVCDVASARAQAAQLDDQAFAAMRSATEAVDASARGQGSSGDADRLWADYKRLRLAAAHLREQPCAPTPPPPVAQIAPPSDARPEQYAAWPRSTEEGPRFRIEGAVSLSDRQPTRASRLGMQQVAGSAIQTGGFYNYSILSTPPTPPPAPDFGAPTVSNSGFTASGSVTSLNGTQPTVRSWSNGLDLSVSFSPQGLDNAGWVFRGSIAHDAAITKSSVDYGTSGYVNVGTSAVTLGCTRILSFFHCNYTQATPVTLSSVIVPLDPAQSRGVSDLLRQDSQNTDVHFNIGRQFGVSALGADVRARAGLELGVGWWNVHEREWLYYALSSQIFTRDVDGPTFLTAVTGGLSGNVWGPVSWSIDGMIGRQTANLTYLWQRGGSAGGALTSTQHDIDAETVGSLSGRLDLVYGPWNAFLAGERRRDLSVASSLTALDAAQRYSVVFPDGTRAGLWPVYSSRLRVGLGYSF